jgi:hypothetical protein
VPLLVDRGAREREVGGSFPGREIEVEPRRDPLQIDGSPSRQRAERIEDASRPNLDELSWANELREASRECDSRDRIPRRQSKARVGEEVEGVVTGAGIETSREVRMPSLIVANHESSHCRRIRD